ncbi:hypothetical protein KSU19_04670 [Enterobacter quasiroggenkampii]|nr:hypothetical protein [Enterobacter quasiroggenkampii]
MAEAVVLFFILVGAKGILSLNSSNTPTGIDRMAGLTEQIDMNMKGSVMYN